MSRIYLDHNATAPLRTEARAAMIEAMDVVGNPSSVHGEGRAAKALVERARAQVAEAVGCNPAEVVFTSGATEAASVLGNPKTGVDVLVDQSAHDALWAQSSMYLWELKPNGPGHTLAMGLANSETGVITRPPEKVEGQWPVGRAAADWLLLDITQAVGRIPFAFSWAGADMAILTGHKFGGPKGVGALIIRDNLDTDPLSVGGGQEMGRRSGTENVIGIAGMGAAIEAAMRDLESGVWDHVEKLRNILETGVEAASKETILVGKDEARIPNTSCLLTPGWKGETQVMAMDLAGFAVSAGSACSSGKVKASRVLMAMGYNEADAACAIRVSLGPENTEEDVTRFVDVWTDKLNKHRARSA
ncbi:cysteine desulfurase [Octadecabacter temperatus]|uniref:Cysteine desulfurase n=1 Tax=Octadecabacter temperatus TaxID=1458307 RepID=A0A0K0Y4L3_9RHOB|nr:cysteine desulfurase family protein [Octadecabacter temperatus]AKS45899.1 Cysteine desulfurase [Octadecabacter temperatus]SIO03057.1 cysteine desulfurase [Octadecabacter temperatus]